MKVARKLACAAVLGGIVLCRLPPATADDGFRFPSQRAAFSTADRDATVVSRFWDRHPAPPVQPASFEGMGGRSGVPNGDLPSWTEAGTLFRWSFDKATGGPNLDEPLVTDRPDFTESSSTVGRGVAQLEMGYTYVYDAEAGDRTRTHSYPQTLLRYGILAEWLELRVGWNYAEEATRVDGVPARAGGSEDLYLGLKFALTPQECLLPEMALIAQMTVPSGSAAFSAGETLPGVNWIYSWEINDWLSTAGSSQFNRAIDEVTGETYLEYAQSWTFGYSLTERLGAYTEWFALIPSGADTVRTQHYFNGGFTFLLSNDIQYDVFAGVGLNRAADDYFLGTGLSMRF